MNLKRIDFSYIYYIYILVLVKLARKFRRQLKNFVRNF